MKKHARRRLTADGFVFLTLPDKAATKKISTSVSNTTEITPITFSNYSLLSMNLEQLVTQLRDLDSSLKSHVTQSANIGLTLRNWLVGAYIVEFEQQGEDRAKYGDHNLPNVLEELDKDGGTTKELRLRQIDPKLFRKMFESR